MVSQTENIVPLAAALGDPDRQRGPCGPCLNGQVSRLSEIRMAVDIGFVLFGLCQIAGRAVAESHAAPTGVFVTRAEPGGRLLGGRNQQTDCRGGNHASIFIDIRRESGLKRDFNRICAAADLTGH